MYLSYTNLEIDNIAGCATSVTSQPTKVMSMTAKEQTSGLSVIWLRENMHYDADTGIFSWAKPGYGRTVGKHIGAGKNSAKNYLALKINGAIFYAHRVAWFYIHGEWPKGQIDHIDGDKFNNAIANLRVATSAQNAARRKTTRFIGPSRGVFPHGAGFVARIHHNGVRHYLGYFPEAEKAKEAYEAKALELHGDFAHQSEAVADKVGFEKKICCEICESTKDLRGDRTNMGLMRGTLCLECWSFAQMAHTSDHMIEKAHKVVAYLRRFERNGIVHDVFADSPKLDS